MLEPRSPVGARQKQLRPGSFERCVWCNSRPCDRQASDTLPSERAVLTRFFPALFA
jgi:hypothetical protein